MHKPTDIEGNSFTLKDGRRLAFAEYGDSQGQALFFFHGGSDSRLEAKLLDRSASEMGLRIIAPDRPGYGYSDFQPGRQLLDWPDDVAELADRLEIKRFFVIGHSGGGSHAAAVAHECPDRVRAVALLGSAAPPGIPSKGLHPLFRLVNIAMSRSKWLHRRLLDQTNRRLLEDPDRFLAEWGTFSRADGRLFEEKKDVGAIIVEEMTEAIRQGVEPIMHEHRLYKRDWGFSLTRIQTPVDIWHGLADRQASIGASQFLDERISSSHLHLVDGAGHFSLLVNHQESIFESLLNL